MRPTLPTALALLIGLAACGSRTDLGAPCRLTRAGAAPGDTPEALSADQVANAELDYVSFGVAECDDLVCARTAGSDNPENRDGAAYGYCTRICATSDDCDGFACEAILPTVTTSDDQGSLRAGEPNRYCVMPRR